VDLRLRCVRNHRHGQLGRRRRYDEQLGKYERERLEYLLGKHEQRRLGQRLQ
jgi:hypothetical protein